MAELFREDPVFAKAAFDNFIAHLKFKLNNHHGAGINRKIAKLVNLPVL
jgi:hypothetical protein